MQKTWLLAAAIALGQQAAPPDPLVKENATVKISEHVYVIPDAGVPIVPNVGIIVGNRATAVVDTGLGTRNGQTVMREVAKASKNADIYVITTHYHSEHTMGGAAFPATAKFVRPKIQQQDIEELGRDFAAAFAARTPVMHDLLEGVGYPRADMLFDREATIDLGGIRVRASLVGPTHTRGDTVIWVESDRVLFSGDVAMNVFPLPTPQSSIKTWIASLDRLESLRPLKIVPSHGPMGDRSMIVRNREFWKTLQARVRELKGQGKSADDAAEIVAPEIQPRYSDWAQPMRIAGAVRAVYAEAP